MIIEACLFVRYSCLFNCHLLKGIRRCNHEKATRRFSIKLSVSCQMLDNNFLKLDDGASFAVNTANKFHAKLEEETLFAQNVIFRPVK